MIDPPDDVYLFLQAPNGALTRTPGSPPGLPDLVELAATSATGQTRVTTISGPVGTSGYAPSADPTACYRPHTT